METTREHLVLAGIIIILVAVAIGVVGLEIGLTVDAGKKQIKSEIAVLATAEMGYQNCQVFRVEEIEPKFDNAREKPRKLNQEYDAFFIVYCSENGSNHAILVSAVVKKWDVLKSDVLFDLVEEGL